ncbi:MAG: endolytic transglycosylase MltG [Lachnospiraceae bacterium]|nr:endolytic transglycosylase MltG [Lachnospiraceae bacterium]
MRITQIISAIFGMLFRLFITVVMIMLVYRLAVFSYSFGYEVFADIPAELSPGIDKTVTIAEGASRWDMAKVLEDKGIVHSAQVFYVQILLSDHKNDWKPGVYEMNTSMHASDIILQLAGLSEEEEEDSDS